MANITLRVPQSVSITCNVVDGYGVPARAMSIQWLSSNPGIAIVTNNGFVAGTNNTVSTNTVQAISNGTCVITVVADNTVIGEIDVLVDTPAPEELQFIISTPVP